MISVVIPLFNEAAIVEVLLERTIESMQRITEEFEIICVDDGSTDKTLGILLQKRDKDRRIKIIELSRNFGHPAAYTAGLIHATGDYIVMMDGDLQDPPEIIPEMFEKIKSNDFDVVYGKRKSRSEPLPKRILIRLFHFIFNRLSRMKVPTNVGNFSIMNRKVCDALMSLPERSRYLPGLRFFVGFKQTFIEYDRPDRFTGKARMGFGKLVKLAFDAIFSFSKLPIKLSLIIGTLGIIISVAGALVVIYKKLIGDAITGWTSTMLGMYFFGSVQLFFLGILGEYVFRIFIESKDRPVYVVRNFYE